MHASLLKVVLLTFTKTLGTRAKKLARQPPLHSLH
jgi:hypothetical protein